MNMIQESPVCAMTLAVSRRTRENGEDVQKSNVSSTRLTFPWWWEEVEMRFLCSHEHKTNKTKQRVPSTRLRSQPAAQRTGSSAQLRMYMFSS